MKFRTGDILIWRSTCFWDSFGEHTINLPGYHSGVIFRGKSLSKYAHGISPSNTYVSFLVDKIYPIEEIILHIWVKPNGSSLTVIKRLSGRHVHQKEILAIYEKLLSMNKRGPVETVRLAVVAYLKFGGLTCKSGHENLKYQFCPAFVSYVLAEFGFIDSTAELNNLLPMDFYNVRFYQTVEYKRIIIFDKQTYKSSWLFSTPLIQWKIITPEHQSCEMVNKLVKDYEYPQIFDR